MRYTGYLPVLCLVRLWEAVQAAVAGDGGGVPGLGLGE